MKRHKTLFRFDLKHFNDDIKMSISFKNEKNVNELKQIFYFMFARNKKIMNEILNFLIENEKIQKISLKIMFFVVSSIFIVWKNNKFKIIIDLKKINIKLYFDAYFFSKKNIILFSLNDSKIFSSINLTKIFFQQNTKFRN